MRDNNWSKGSNIRGDYGRFTSSHPDPRTPVRGAPIDYGRARMPGHGGHGTPVRQGGFRTHAAAPAHGGGGNVIEEMIIIIKELEHRSIQYESAIIALEDEVYGKGGQPTGGNRSGRRDEAPGNPRTRAIIGGGDSRGRTTREAPVSNPRRGNVVAAGRRAVEPEFEEEVVQPVKEAAIEKVADEVTVEDSYMITNIENKELNSKVVKILLDNLNDEAPTSNTTTAFCDSIGAVIGQEVSGKSMGVLQNVVIVNEHIRISKKSFDFLLANMSDPREFSLLLASRLRGEGAEGSIEEVIFASAINKVVSTLLNEYSRGRFKLPIDSFVSDFELLCDFIKSEWGVDRMSELYEYVREVLYHCFVSPYNTWLTDHPDDTTLPLLYERTVFISNNYALALGGDTMPIGQVYSIAKHPSVMRRHVDAMTKLLPIGFNRPVSLITLEGAHYTIQNVGFGEVVVTRNVEQF